MKWFKHMTDMSEDVKIKRLIRKFGIEGYGLYCYILEKIVKKLETDSPIPELEETANDIASDVSSDTLRVEEVMLFCIDQGLLSHDEVTGRLTAHKIYRYLQQSETRSAQIRGMIGAYKGVSQTVSDKCEEENRIEQKRDKSANRVKKAPHETLGVPVGVTRYSSLCEIWGKARVDAAIQARMDWEDSKGKPKARDYAAAAARWLDVSGDTPPVKPTKAKGFQERRKEMFGDV